MAYTKAIFRINLQNGNDAARSALTGCNMTNSGGVVSVNKTAHGLVNGAVVTVPSGTYSGDWLVKVTDPDNFTLHTNHAIGILTVSGAPAVNDTFVIGSQTFTFKSSRLVTGEVTIGADVYDTAENIAFAINTDIGGITANYMAFVGDVAQPFTEGVERVAVYYMQPGTAGNIITFTENATNISVDGAGTLTGGANSTYSADRSNVSITPFGGMSWTDAWKTPEFGATATRIAAGDTIITAKTDDKTNTGQNATFTNNGDIVLTTAVTQKIEDAVGNTWTVSANVTGAANAGRKYGATSQSLSIAAGFTTGKVAYKTINELDLSSYEQISFWIWTNIVISAASSFSIALCSDTSGDVIVNTLNIPAMRLDNNWYPITINNGSALGSSIKSIAIYQNTDVGAVTLLLNHFIACKARTSTDALELGCAVGKNNGEWWSVGSIDGTTIKIDGGVYSNPSTTYYGTTETVTLWKVTGIDNPQTATSYTWKESAGTSPLTYNCHAGWNTTTNVRDGNTVIKGNSTKNAVAVFSVSGNGWVFAYWGFISVGSAFNISENDVFRLNYIKNCWASNGQFSGNIVVVNCICTCTGIGSGSGWGIRGSSELTQIINSRSVKSQHGIVAGRVINSKALGCVGGNGFGSYGNMVLINSETDASTEYFYNAYNKYAKITSLNHDNTLDNNWIFEFGATANMQTATKGGSGKEWKTIISSLERNLRKPFEFTLAKVAVKASKLVTVTCYCAKDHATNIAAALVAKAQTGVLNVETSVTKASDTNRELLTLTFTPSAAGVVEIIGRTWYVAGNSNSYFDTISITQAN